MKMKDKLYKNHHKGIYYLLRNAVFSTIIIASATCLVAIPTYISLKAADESARAEEGKEDKTNEIEKTEMLAF